MSGEKWDSKEMQILKDLSDRGYGSKDIVLVLRGRTVDSIASKMKKMGIHCKFPEPSIDYELLKKFMKEK